MTIQQAINSIPPWELEGLIRETVYLFGPIILLFVYLGIKDFVEYRRKRRHLH